MMDVIIGLVVAVALFGAYALGRHDAKVFGEKQRDRAKYSDEDRKEDYGLRSEEER